MPAGPAPEASDDLPQTGAGDLLPVLVLAGGALLLTGLGVVLLVPLQRRRGQLTRAGQPHAPAGPPSPPSWP